MGRGRSTRRKNLEKFTAGEDSFELAEKANKSVGQKEAVATEDSC